MGIAQLCSPLDIKMSPNQTNAMIPHNYSHCDINTLKYSVSDLLAIQDLSREPEAINMLDDSNTTCFGFEDRADKTLARTMSVELIAFNQDQSPIHIV